MYNHISGRMITQTCRRLLHDINCDFVGFAIQEENRSKIIWDVGIGSQSNTNKPIYVYDGKGLAGQVLLTESPVEIESFPEDISGVIWDYPVMLMEQLYYAFAVPVLHEDKPKAVLLVGRRMNEKLSESERNIIVDVAEGLKEVSYNIHTELDLSNESDQLSIHLDELIDYKFALDASSVVAITDATGIITYVNDQFCRVSQYSRSELIGQGHKILNSGFHSKDFFITFWNTIRSGDIWKGEIKNKAKDGTYYWVDTTVVPFLDKEGQPYQYLEICHGISERKRYETELKLLMAKIIDVQEDERKFLSRELHDEVGQNLYSLLITISRIKNDVNHVLLDDMEKEALKIIEAVRSISWELRPSVLDDLGLVPAIRSYLAHISKHHQINVHFDCYLVSRLSAKKEINIYRIIQEALTNIRKYANVDEAIVTIREIDDVIRILIEDDGVGFNIHDIKHGVGLSSMKERAYASEGQLKILSEIGQGTKLILEIPL